MITLTLLHPLQSVPVQSWTFDSESVIRIGRSTDNDVILYSAVVSRRHVELRCGADGWEVVSLGANGTYWDEKPIAIVPVVDKMVIRLASSGPKIQIRLGAKPSADEVPPPSSQPDSAPTTHSPSLDSSTELEDQTQFDLRDYFKQ